MVSANAGVATNKARINIEKANNAVAHVRLNGTEVSKTVLPPLLSEFAGVRARERVYRDEPDEGECHREARQAGHELFREGDRCTVHFRTFLPLEDALPSPYGRTGMNPNINRKASIFSKKLSLLKVTE